MAKGKKGFAPRGAQGVSPQGMGGMGNLLGQMQKLQAEMEKTQAELEQEEITVTAGGGMIALVMTGKKQLRSITIKPEVVDPDDVEMLQDLVMAAVNDAIQQVEKRHEERMSALTGGLNLPSGMGL